MGTFVIARRSQEYRPQRNGTTELVDVLNFGGKNPTQYATLEEAAEACDKIVRGNVLSTWCTFKLVAETKLDTEAPIKTYLTEENSASGAES